MIKVMALFGKAGSGKTSICDALCTGHPQSFHKVVTCTTRPIREGETNGKDYFFLTKKEFIQKINRKEMVEYSCFNNWLYGTDRKSFDKNKINIVVVNPEGLKALYEDKDIELTPYYIEAKDKTRLLRQLLREKNPNVHEIIRRFSADEKDFADNKLYFLKSFYTIDNDTSTISEIVALIMRLNEITEYYTITMANME